MKTVVRPPLPYIEHIVKLMHYRYMPTQVNVAEIT